MRRPMTTIALPDDDLPHGDLWEHLPLDITGLCPVTGNFQPGTRALLSYRAGRRALRYEVLHAYVRGFVGGGQPSVSSAEEVLLRIAHWSAAQLQAPVKLRVWALLHDGTTPLITVRARPVSEQGGG